MKRLFMAILCQSLIMLSLAPYLISSLGRIFSPVLLRFFCPVRPPPRTGVLGSRGRTEWSEQRQNIAKHFVANLCNLQILIRLSWCSYIKIKIFPSFVKRPRLTFFKLVLIQIVDFVTIPRII